MDAGDVPTAEDLSILGKRKWSPDNASTTNIIGDVREESSSNPILAIGIESAAPKRIRLPPKPDFLSQSASTEQTQKLVACVESLPPEILQHIFSYVDLFSLGNLVCVNRLFQALLNPKFALPPGSANVKHLHLRPQGAIWSLAKRRWLPNMPRSMASMSDYDTLKLVIAKRCQFCGSLPRHGDAHSTSQWSRGPGPDSVRIIWPFRIRSCSSCLHTRIKKVGLREGSVSTSS